MLKKLGCKFIIINTSKIGYDAGYEASKMQIFIGKFKDRQLKKLQKKNKKKQENKMETLRGQTTQQEENGFFKK